jgi:hypothetical protein
MKRILSVFTLMLALAFAVQAQDQPVESPAAPASNAKMEFQTLEVDYGTIEQGADPFRVFEFTNTGTDPLLITNAKGSCGCTVPTYPKEPIPPGETGEIKVRYDTNRVGPFTKKVTINTNAGTEPIVLTIKGKVEQKEAAPDGVPASGGSMFNGGF